MARLDADGNEGDANVAKSARSAISIADHTGLPHGDALTIEEAAELTADRAHRVIAVLGDRKAGKTTLLAEMHQAFLSGPFAGLLFAGSDTMFAYEKRCALGRVRSRLAIPSTARTPFRDGIRLLQLAVRREDLGDHRQELLFTDISGELSSAARKSKADAKELAPILRHSAQIVVVVDGEKVAAQTKRHRVRSDTKTLLRALVEADALPSKPNVDLVVNKCDCFASDEGLKSFAEDLLAECASYIEPHANRTRSLLVAARPRGGGALRWQGLADLLYGWVVAPRAAPISTPEENSRSTRAFLEFGHHEMETR